MSNNTPIQPPCDGGMTWFTF